MGIPESNGKLYEQGSDLTNLISLYLLMTDKLHQVWLILEKMTRKQLESITRFQ